MKLIVSTNVLLKRLQAVQGVISSNTVLPILENFLFNIQDGKLVISTTDLHTSMTTETQVQGEGSLKAAIPSKILIETLKTLPDQPITIDINEANFAVEIISENGKYRLSGENGEDFPRIPAMEQANTFNIPAKALLKGITSSIFATGSDEIRLAMTGVFFELLPNSMNFVATDAHKMVVHKFKDIVIPNPGSFIVPKKALNLLKSVLPNDETPVTVEYNNTNLFIAFNDIQMICRLIDQKYPDYNSVIPTANPNQLRIGRLDFLNCLRRISIYANKTTYQVRLKLQGSGLTVSAEDLDFANQAVEQLMADYDGADLEIGFNARFLIEMLNNLDADDIKLDLSIASKPGLLFPIISPENEETLMLIMPVMLNSHSDY